MASVGTGFVFWDDLIASGAAVCPVGHRVRTLDALPCHVGHRVRTLGCPPNHFGHRVRTLAAPACHVEHGDRSLGAAASIWQKGRSLSNTCHL